MFFKWLDYIFAFVIMYFFVLFFMPAHSITVSLLLLPVVPAFLYSLVLGTISNLVRMMLRKSRDE